MWWVIPVALVTWDFCKPPLDILYFQNPWRPLVGMRNTLVDLLCGHGEHPRFDLWPMTFYFETIRHEFVETEGNIEKHYFHDMDPWFPKNTGYYYYKVSDFPILQSIIDTIPCIDKETGVIAVIEGPMSIAPHRAESNLQLRYHMTLEGSGDCTLHTWHDAHVHKTSDEFIFDHARYHSLEKTSSGRRVTIILDVHRF